MSACKCARPVSSGDAGEALSPAARIGDLASLRAGAQRQLTEAQTAAERAARSLAALAAREPQAAAQAEVRRLEGRARAVGDALAVGGVVPGLSEMKPAEDQRGVDE